LRVEAEYPLPRFAWGENGQGDRAEGPAYGGLWQVSKKAMAGFRPRAGPKSNSHLLQQA